MERREAIRMLVLSSLPIGALAACSSGGGTPTPTPTRAGVRIPLADIPVGGGTILSEAKIVATQAVAGQYRAFSAVCQHQGCTVGSIEDGTIVCPCHFSRYSIADGSVVNGPTTKPLIPASSASVEGTDLVVVK